MNPTPPIDTNTREPLFAWLDRVRAVQLWAMGEGQSFVRCYAINGHPVLVHLMPGGGWELYLPASKRNSIALSLDAAAVHCGVEGCAGLLPY